jgi:trigger factor
MKTSVKNLSNTKVELTISLDKAELGAAEQVALTKMARKIKVPGFRQGKAPASVAARYVDPVALAQQALEDALSKAVAEAFLKENLQALERPEVDIKSYEPGTTLEFTAEAEVLPKVRLGDYKHLEVEKPKVTVTAAEVTDVLERMQKSMAEKKEVSRAAKNGDEAIIDFTGKKDGIAFEGGTGNDYPLVLGSHSFIPGFEEGIVSKKPDETFDIDVTFPKDYHAADLAGAAVTFTVTLKKLNEFELPELTDEFAAKAGPFKTMAELKSDIKSELKKQKDTEANAKIKDELVSKLVDSSTVPVPDILLTDQIRSVEQDFTQNLAYQGIMLDQYLKDKGYDSRDKWLDEEVRPVAKKRVQAGLALAELSKVEHVTAATKEVDDQIARFKQQYAKQPQMVAQLDQPETRRDIANRLLTDKTVEHLVALNTKS